MSNESPSLVKDNPNSSNNKNNQPKKSASTPHRTIKWMWRIFFGGLLFVVAFFFALAKGWIVKLPDTADLENPSLSIASEAYSYDGKLIGKYFKENSLPVRYEELPQSLVDAAIATEDERFEDHSGIDFTGVLRAVGKMGSDGGGSTISQQVAKMLFSEQQGQVKGWKRIPQKLAEWVIAVDLEKRFTKEELIALYYNKYTFEYNVTGIKMAARTYFMKEPKDLTIDESAMLLGMFKASSSYNPHTKYEAAKARRNVVLDQMVKNGKLTSATAEELKAKETIVKYNKKTEKVNNNSYFKDFLKEEVESKLIQAGVVKPNGKPYDIESDGLKVYTTIDSRMQENAEGAVRKHLTGLQRSFFSEKRGNPNFPFRGNTIGPKTINEIMMRAVRLTQRYKGLKDAGKSEEEIMQNFKTPIKMKVFAWEGDKEVEMSPWDSIRYYKSFLQTGLMSMEPQTGYIKAWVGGIDYNYFQYDHVKKGSRQVGSTFKPFVYATAISEKHYSPCTPISNANFNSGGWHLKGSGGDVQLRVALAKSLNAVTARLIEQTTPKPVIQLCTDLGIDPKYFKGKEKDLTIALGTTEITVYEMTAAYSAFANKGIYTKPVAVWRIEDKDGQILYEYKPETREVFSPEVAYTMLKIMQGAADIRGGTSTRIRGMGLSNPIACKTGTTNSNADGWFIGMVPNLVTAVWVGCEDRSAHFQSTGIGQGASIALPIWGYYMKSNYANKALGISSEEFERPELPEDSDFDFDCTGDNYATFGDPAQMFLGSDEGDDYVPNEGGGNSVNQDSVDINTQIQQNNDNPEDVFN